MKINDSLLGLFCILGIIWVTSLAIQLLIKGIAINIENKQCQQTLQQLIKEQL